MKSEIITNPDGSIYHLHLQKEHIHPHVITVGDPGRVELVEQFLDKVTYQGQYREFRTTVGTYKNVPITVISTGIGTDNVDIVFNEIELLLNYDLETGERIAYNSINYYRIGTSGSLSESVKVDSILLSAYGVGLDGLMHFYDTTYDIHEKELALKVNKKLHKSIPHIKSYAKAGSKKLIDQFSVLGAKGITVTATGFYGPQGRATPSPMYAASFLNSLESIEYQDMSITNLEMETSGIYGLADMHGHQAISLNAILANRVKGTFSKNPSDIIKKLIQDTLELIAES